MTWGVTFVALHNVFYAIGWYGDSYDLATTLRKLARTIAFADVEPLLVPVWFVESLFKGLVLTYAVCLLPRKWQQWTVVTLMYLASLWFYSHGMHLFYSINREIGVVSAIYLAHELRGWSHAVTWWQWVAVTAVLAATAPFCYVAPVNDALGPLFVFPIASLLGTLFIRGIVVFTREHVPQLFRGITWMGRHSLHILFLHLAGFRLLSHILILLGGYGDKSGLTGIVLPECAYTPWWIAYTAVGIAAAALYLGCKRGIIALWQRRAAVA